MTAEVRAVIDRLGLRPHPEGGHYREIHRSAATVRPADERPVRRALTTIYYLLVQGEHSRWHRVRSDEVWHFYGGHPLRLHIAPASAAAVDQVTLSGLDGDGCLVHVVPAGCWQAARPLGAYSLVGCTVAPGFEFEDFSFLADDPAARCAIEALDPDGRALI